MRNPETTDAIPGEDAHAAPGEDAPRTTRTEDWDPRDPEVLEDQITAYDRLRRRCPVAHSEFLGWSVLRHADVLAVLEDHETYSNEVSAHLSVPNGMDPPEHTAYRTVIDRYFTPERMAAFEPACRETAVRLVDALPRGSVVELMESFARTFALRMQSRWLDWPESLEEPLRAWTRKNHRATLARDREAMAAVALEFDRYIREQLDARRRAGDDAPQDITTELLGERVDGRPLPDEAIVSILRNWTVGELSTIAASAGILVDHLARRPDLQQQLREDPADLPAAIDEILRIHPPLVANRRKATRDVELGGRRIRAGERVTILWAAANRDEAVFEDPDEFRPEENAADNLLYGRGIHVCPGAPLARLELRVLLEELLARTQSIELAGIPDRAAYPASGYVTLPVFVS